MCCSSGTVTWGSQVNGCFLVHRAVEKCRSLIPQRLDQLSRNPVVADIEETDVPAGRIYYAYGRFTRFWDALHYLCMFVDIACTVFGTGECKTPHLQDSQLIL